MNIYDKDKVKKAMDGGHLFHSKFSKKRLLFAGHRISRIDNRKSLWKL